MKKDSKPGFSGVAGKSARDRSRHNFKNSRFAENWKKGAIGEEAAGKVIEEISFQHNFRFLHDRKISGSKANIDHILITNRGIFVIDTKNYTGSVRIKESGGLFTPYSETLYVGGRNQTKLVLNVKKQVDLVTEALLKSYSKLPVFGVLAFYNADFPILFKPKEIYGVLINSKGIESLVLSKPKIGEVSLEGIHNYLASIFLNY